MGILREVSVMGILRAVSGVAARCGVLPRAGAAVATMGATAWLASQLWAWGAENDWQFAPAAFLVTGVYAVAAAGVMSSTYDSMVTMTRNAPFVVWQELTDGRVTAWKLLFWPLLVPAEGFVCLWLIAGWFGRLMNADLSGTRARRRQKGH